MQVYEGDSMSDDIKAGYLESHPRHSAQIRDIDIPAPLWDEVLHSDYHLPHPWSTPLCFDWIIIGWRDRASVPVIDFERPDSISNHEYARLLLKRAKEMIEDSFPEVDPDAPNQSNDAMAAMIELGEN
jgi:hypothetical protein